MDANEEARIRDFAREVVAESLRRIANQGRHAHAVYESDLRAEAERLTKPPEAPKPDFEGVKYVVSATWPNRPWAVATREDFRRKHGGTDPPADEPNAILVREPGGHVGVMDAERLSPWHPEVGEKVWVKGQPCQAVIESLPHPGCSEYLVWANGMGRPLWKELSSLRPFSFAPAPEKPRFEPGELVVTAEGYLRIAARGGGWLDYEGHWSEYACQPRPASLDDMMHCAQHFPAALYFALRAHAKRLAQEAK